MNQQKDIKTYFNRSLLIYWILLGIIILTLSPFLGNKFYDSSFIQSWERDVVVADSLRKIEDSLKKEETSWNEKGKQLIVWKWRDFKGKGHILKLPVDTGYVEMIAATRQAMTGHDYSIYGKLDVLCDSLTSQLAELFKKEISAQNYSSSEKYMRSMELIATAIQEIPYTLVLDTERCPYRLGGRLYRDQCEACADAKGCCDNVNPFAVYSPSEFFIKKTGDCDTRSLFAYAVMRKLGFKVAIMGSDSEAHSVLGVLAEGRNYNRTGRGPQGEKYALWELTAKGWKMGEGVQGNDWKVMHK